MKVVIFGLKEILKRIFWVWLGWWPAFVWIALFWWFALYFQPVVFSDAHLREIGNGNFRYTSVSRKPWPSTTLCVIESATVVIETDNNRTTFEKDNAPGWGTGSEDWKTWPHEGKIPVLAKILRVHKVLRYRCLGFIEKVVKTPERVIDLN